MSTRTASPNRLGIPLAIVAGYCDAVSFVALFGVFVSHMSGTTTRLGVEVGYARWAEVVPFAVVIVAFVAGAAAGAACVGSAVPNLARLLLGAEIALLLAAAVLGAIWTGSHEITSGGAKHLVIGGLVTFAMGIQSGGVRLVAGLSVNTTYISGMLTEAGEHLAGLVRRRPGSLHQFAVHVGVWAAFLAGGICGAIAVDRLGIVAVGIAAPVLGAVALVWPGGDGASPAAAARP